MSTEFSGIERRLDELCDRLARLQPLTDKTRGDLDEDPYLRDIIERNLEVAAQCCLDIAHRIISLEGARKPVDYYDAILRMGDLGVLPAEFAQRLAPLAGFRNILVHGYLLIDWDEVYRNLHQLEDLERFAELVRAWLRQCQVARLPGCPESSPAM
jgi:uncharacterized protein YutE (UPF0331/DUF86 family)